MLSRIQHQESSPLDSPINGRSRLSHTLVDVQINYKQWYGCPSACQDGMLGGFTGPIIHSLCSTW